MQLVRMIEHEFAKLGFRIDQFEALGVTHCAAVREIVAEPFSRQKAGIDMMQDRLAYTDPPRVREQMMGKIGGAKAMPEPGSLCLGRHREVETQCGEIVHIEVVGWSIDRIVGVRFIS